MEQSYLIQRLKKPINLSRMGFKTSPFSFGGGYPNGGLSDEVIEFFNPLFSFDYMGAAEFEFGALPKALKKLFSSAMTANVMEVDSGDGDGSVFEVWYICDINHVGEVTSRIASWAKAEPKNGLTKECIHLDKSIRENDPRFIGWIELDNGFMFFIDKKPWDAIYEMIKKSEGGDSIDSKD